MSIGIGKVVITVAGVVIERSLPATGQDPYSSKDLKDSDVELRQRRYYGEDGRAEMDNQDSDNSHTFPLRHDWDWSQNPPRGKAY